MREEEKYYRNIVDKLIELGMEENLVLIEIVRRAEFSDHWGYRENKVMIGKSENTSEFATLFFHEAGHAYLGVGSTFEEERECYLFSRRMCQRLGIEYNFELEKHGLDFVNLPKICQNRDEFERRVDKIPEHFLALLSLLPQTR